MGRGRGLLILQQMLTNSLLLTAFEVTPFFFRVQICHIQSLVSKHCDLKRITSFYCFKRVVEKFQTGILKESTANNFTLRARKRKFLSLRMVNILGKKKKEKENGEIPGTEDPGGLQSMGS